MEKPDERYYWPDGSVKWGYPVNVQHLIIGICLDCRRWLHEPNRLQMCGACHEKYDKAMKEFAELLLATHKLKEGRT